MLTSPRLRTPRKFLTVAVTTLFSGAALIGATSSTAQAASALPTPTKIVVSQLTAQSFRLNIGGTTAKLYSVFVNGRIFTGAVSSSSTEGFGIRDLNQNTDYRITVQQILLPSGRASALSAPTLVHTPNYVAPARPNAPTGARASAVTATAADLSWTASTTSGVTYRLFLNGEAVGVTSQTTFNFAPSYQYPSGEIVPGSGLRPGRNNRLAVAAIAGDGAISVLTEVSVRTPGTAVSFPSSPTNLQVTATTNRSIEVNWTPSTDRATPETALAYRIHVDGQLIGYTCTVYCFGVTGAIAEHLAPGTTYRIGIEAINATGGVSAMTEVLATTASP